jgi:anti-sigma28 factor (negative regulator of flagellin synthesis)
VKDPEPIPVSPTSGGAVAVPKKADVTPEELREARIEELRNQHLSGTYSVDAAKVSGKIIDSHLKH